MTSKVAIRGLKRRPDGTMGVVYIDPSTGLEISDITGYQIADQTGGSEFTPQDQVKDNNKDDTEGDESSGEDSNSSKAIKDADSRRGGDRYGSVYSSNDVFDRPDEPISHTISRTTNSSKSVGQEVDKANPLSGSVQSSTRTPGYNPSEATGGTLDGVSRAPVDPSGAKTKGSKGTIGSFDRAGLSESARGMVDKMAAAGYGDLGVNSSYRDPQTNAKVGGAKGSQHLHGNAVDVSLNGLTDAQKEGALDAALSAGAAGIGLYPGGAMHIDTRDKTTMWGPKGYAGSTVSEMPGWAQDNLQAKLNAGEFSYLSQHNVATPTARPSATEQASLTSDDSPSFAKESVRESLTPAQYASQGYAPRTAEEKQAAAMAIAGELSPNSLAALSMGDETAMSEVANMLGALENRAVTKQTSLTDQLSPTQVNSMDPKNMATTQNNFSKYGQDVMKAVDSFYAGAMPNALSVPNATHWANMDVVSLDWAGYADNSLSVGDHTFFGGLNNTAGQQEYGLPGFANPRDTVNDMAGDSWANKAGESIANSSPFGGKSAGVSSVSNNKSSVGMSGISGGKTSGSLGDKGSYSGSSVSGAGAGAGARGSVSLGGTSTGHTSSPTNSGTGLGAGARGSVSLGGSSSKSSSSSSSGIGKGGSSSSVGGGLGAGASGSAFGGKSSSSSSKSGGKSSDGMGGRSDGWT